MLLNITLVEASYHISNKGLYKHTSAKSKSTTFSALPRRGGNGGSLGRRMRETTLPPISAQMKRTVMPNRFPPGRHSSSVTDQTTPKSTAARRTGEDTGD